MKPGGDFLVRPVAENDLDGLIELDQAIFGRLAYERFVFRQLFYAHSRLFFVAEIQNQLAGFAIASYDAGGSLAWVLSLGVHSGFRKRGTGRALLVHTEHQLKSLGASEISLHVAPENKIALELYKKDGYIEKGLIADFGGKGVDRLTMTKKL